MCHTAEGHHLTLSLSPFLSVASEVPARVTFLLDLLGLPLIVELWMASNRIESLRQNKARAGAVEEGFRSWMLREHLSTLPSRAADTGTSPLSTTTRTAITQTTIMGTTVSRKVAKDCDKR
jgi:hypothetical protein